MTRSKKPYTSRLAAFPDYSRQRLGPVREQFVVLSYVQDVGGRDDRRPVRMIIDNPQRARDLAAQLLTWAEKYETELP